MFQSRIRDSQHGGDSERDFKVNSSNDSKNLVKLFEEITEFGKAKQL